MLVDAGVAAVEHRLAHHRTARGPRLRAWALSLWAAGSVILLALHLIWPLPSQSEDPWWPWVSGLMAFPVAAAVVLAHRPGNGVGRTLATVAVAANVIFFVAWIAATLPTAEWTRWWESVSNPGAVAQFAGLTALLWLFPTGRPPPGFVVAFRVNVAVMVVLLVVMLVAPGPLPVTGRTNPLAVEAHWLGGLADSGFVAVPLSAAVGVAALVARRRRADGVVRAQLRWFLAGTMVLLVLLALVSFSTTSSDPVIENAAGLVIIAGFWSLPAAITIAILRYRLYDIDRVVSRTVAYAVLVALLAAVYGGAVVGLQTVIPIAGSDVVVAGSTLLVAALFAPLRRRVQHVVDRRFNRSRVAAELVTEQFGHGLRSAVDPLAVHQDLVAVVAATLQPASTWVWEPTSR